MGFFSNLISSSKTVSLLLIPFLLLLLSSLPTTIQKEQGFFSVLISDNGLHFAKDLIVQKAISSIIPLQLPQIEKHVAVPLIGDVEVVLSEVTINSVDVTRSFVESGETGLVLVVPNATAQLSINWSYLYSSWFVEVSDYGTASVEVQGLSLGVSLGLEDDGGALKLSVLDSGCHVKTLLIKLDGGSSWFYQWFVDYFQDLIVSRVEVEITKKIKESVFRLDSVLQSLPRQIPVYDNAAMNVTFVKNPILTNTSIEFDIDGSFVATKDSVPRFYHDHLGLLNILVPSDSSLTMVEISLHEKIFDSASSVLFHAGYFRWTFDKADDESYLNTAKWKYIVPKLYKEYPNEAMNLNVSLSSPPTISVSDNGISVAIRSDIIVGVLDKGEAVPVLCLSLEISASCAPEMAGNKLVGTLELIDFEMSLQWSKVGNLHMHLLQTLVSTILKRIAVPYANVYIQKGLPLPMLSGFTLRNAEISFAGSKLVICSDVVYAEQQFKSLTQYVL